MAISYTITVNGIPGLLAELNRIKQGLDNPKEGLVRATNKVADVFMMNYVQEGGMVGGWEALSEQTLAMREWQGFDPGPIMYRYGELRKVAVEFFQKVTGDDSTSEGDNYSNNVTSARFSVSGTKATLWVGGSYKVMNQYGYPDTNGSGNNPARPFWFVGPNVSAAARDGIFDWLKDEVMP